MRRLAAGISLLVVLAAVGCGGGSNGDSDTSSSDSSSSNTDSSSWPDDGPKPVIVSSSFIILNGPNDPGGIVVIVECTVRNAGETGDVELIAEIKTSEGKWTKSHTTNMPALFKNSYELRFGEPTEVEALVETSTPQKCSAKPA